MTNYETVETSPQPMLYLSRRTGMAPADVSRVMQESFDRIGAFITRKNISPAGPPLSIYRDWDGKEMIIDVGFPVAEPELFKAEGELKTGHTPARRALKAIHRGPYDDLRKTYENMEAHFREQGLPMPDLSWEVYVSDPDNIPPEDLLTEVYMPLTP
jgi:effector-binding domain-containing protein